MPDGSNLSSILPSALPQAYSTPEESLAASQPAAAAPPATSLDALPQAYSTPEASLVAQPAAPVSTPAPAQPVAATSLDALPQAYSTPEESLAAPQSAPMATITVRPQPTEAPPQQTGLISGIIQGVGASGREAAQLATGNAFTTDPNAQPEPTRSWWNELGYGLGHSWPTVAAGFGGGAAGEAVGGPVGAVAGAALGVGGTSLLQDLVPAYQSAMAGGQMSHDQAVDYAVKHALASGAIGAATAPLFNLAPFKSVIGKILFQSLATQPAVGAAGRVGVPLVMGEPLPSGEQMVRGVGQDVATGLAFGVGHQVGGRVVEAVRGRPGPVETPPPEPPVSEPPPETVVPPPAPVPDASTPVVAPPDAVPATEPVPAPAPERTTEPVPGTPPVEASAAQAAPAIPASETPVPSETVPALPAPAVPAARTETETPSPASTEPTGITPEEMKARADRLRQQFPLLGQNAAGEDVLERPDGKRIVLRANGWVDNETNALSGGEYEAAGGYNPKFKVVTPNPDLTRTPPPDDGSGSTAGRTEPTAAVGQTGTAGLPGEQSGGVRPGDTGVGTADTQAAPPPDQGQAGQTAPPTDVTAVPGGFSLEQIPLRRQWAQPNDHSYTIKDPNGETVGTVDTKWDPDTGNLHIADIQSEGGKNTLGLAAVRQLRTALLEQYPEAKTLTGRRITGATYEGTMSGVGPGREATQKIVPAQDGIPKADQEPVPGTTRAPTGDQQLDRLIATRNDPKTEPMRFRGLDQQIAAREQTLQAKDQGGPRVGGRTQPFRGPPQVRAEADHVRDYKFNNGTSVYDSVFEQAGKDPRVMVNRPMEEQIHVLTRHMTNTLGFRDVAVEGRQEGSEPSPVDRKIARDAMLDMTRATQDLMSDLGLPYEAAGDFGRLRLVIDPEGSKGYYGQYSTAGEIRVTGGANSFGHEWAHAMDHKLADRLMGAGNATALLTRYARAGQLDPRDGVQGAVARLMNVMFFDRAAEAARRIDLQNRAAAVDRLGNPTKAALQAQQHLARLEAGASHLRIKPTEFRAGALRSPKPDYYADPAELFARAHEAWMAWKMKASGHDPRGAVMPDAAYIAETNRMMKDYYPQAEDRMNIFKAFEDLHDTMRNENVLSNGKTPQGPANLGISDDLHYGATVPPGADPQLVGEARTMVNKTKRLINSLLNATAITDASRPTGEYPWYRRMADYARSTTFSHHGIMETVIGRAPDAVKPLLREMLDRVAAAPGEGRYTPEHFEEAVRKYARGWTDRFAKILTSAGYKNADAMSVQDGDMLRHFLTTGETRYPLNPNAPTGPSKAIPEHLLTAGGRLRRLMDEVWRATHDVGIDVGYARSGYYPRMYDAFKATASETSKLTFLKQAHLLHSKMFDTELGDPGSDPTALLEKWTTLSKADRQIEPRGGSGDVRTLAGHMNNLRKNLRRQAEIEEALKAGPDPALEAEQTRLKTAARQIAEDAHPMLRDHTSALEANAWLHNLMAGGLHDFDTAGPSGKYLKTRVLPPEADQIMRDFMRTSPTDALPNYFHAAARRIAFAERFGAHGEDLDALMAKVHDNLAMNTHDANWFHEQMLAVTGQQNTRGMSGLMKFSNVIHAAGSIALMPRAAWSALAEPMNAALATSSMKVGFETFANQFGQLMKTASARERTEMAQYLGTVTSAMHDSIMLNRMSANYADSPALNKFMTQYYRITGLTQLTNSQRIAATAASNGFLAKLSRDYQGTNEVAKDTATRWFRELGLNDPIHGDFAKWMTDFEGGRPTVRQLQTDPMAGAYSLATRRLTDRTIQDPYKVDRAAMSSTPFVGLAFQLMSFNYQFQRNVLQPAMDNIAHAYKQRGMLAAGGSAVHAAAMAGTMVAAGILTTALRQYLFAPDQWQKQADEGNLGGYLIDLAMQRSGLNGTLDPLIQLGSHLRYEGSVGSLLEGASLNWMAKNAQDVINPFVMANDSPNTNTRYFNAARGAFNLVGVPAAAYALTTLGGVGGAAAKVAAGTALQFGTSPGAAAAFAGAVAGEKGAQLPKETDGKLPELPGLAGLPSLPSEGGDDGEAKGKGAAQDASGGVIPWGLADDVAKPAWQVLGEPAATALARVPGPLKVLGGLGAAAYGAKSFLDTTAPWRGPDARPPKAAEGAAARP